MKLNTHDLQQLDEASIQRLTEPEAGGLCERLLEHLKEAPERLEQTPENRWRPPTSRPPWQRAANADDNKVEDEVKNEPGPYPTAESASQAAGEKDRAADHAPVAEEEAQAAKKKKRPKRRSGKQLGAPGLGRTQKLRAERFEIHRPCYCHGRNHLLPEQAPVVAYTGYQSIELERGGPDNPGPHLRVIDHHYQDVVCARGQPSRAAPHRSDTTAMQRGVLSVWCLIGPGLAALIIALHQRQRLSRVHTREWLMDWLDLAFSTGLIHATLRESAAALEPLEETLIGEIQRSDLANADKTSWPEQERKSQRLWAFLSATTTLFVFARRRKATVSRVLEHYTGHLMCDGWFSYRGYPRRLRCWAHLFRKAQGLIDHYHPDGRVFGHQVRSTLEILIEAVYAACEGPTQAPWTYITDATTRRHAGLDLPLLTQAAGASVP